MPRSPRTASRLVYRDEAIIAFDKAAGLPVIPPDGSNAPCLLDLATAELRRKNPKARAAVVHRLDRDTSGLVIFACSAAHKKTIMDNWGQTAKKRIYLAVVLGDIQPPQGQLRHFLRPHGSNRVELCRPGDKSGLEAISDYRLLCPGSGFSLIELSLQTGRKHQIRAQCAAIGHPVLGDFVYTPPRKAQALRPAPARMYLHALSLSVLHPITGRLLVLEAPVPDGFFAPPSPRQER